MSLDRITGLVDSAEFGAQRFNVGINRTVETGGWFFPGGVH